MALSVTKASHRAVAYLNYLAKGTSIHKVHPPFAFDFYSNILKQKISPEKEKTLDQIRNKGLKNKNIIEHTDMGSRSGKRPYLRSFKTVGKIVKDSSISKKYGSVLFNLVRYYQPLQILEFGTAAGISTLYMALAKQNEARLITMEGCSETATVARSNFKKTHNNDIEVLTGEFDALLPLATKMMPQVDMVYIDGNHTKNATISYFNALLEHVHNNSIIVLDDIHWSGEMTEAWKEIIQNSEITLSIDLFKLGVVFFKKDLSKQHMILRY